MKRGSPTRWLGAFLFAIATSGCAHTTNVAMQQFDPHPDATYRFNPRDKSDTLVVVNLSGGGIRAAALSYGVLQELAKLPGLGADRLLDQIDIISSVSGGSVTAGWYALKGREGLEAADARNTLWDFLHHDWTDELAWRGLNPLSLARYAFTDYARSDVLANFFADKLYGQATYAQLLERYRIDPHQPYVLLNATDLGHESGFTFTQGQFDFICSDLSRYRLADAVAASANFPFAFSATGIRNYSGAGCRAQASDVWKGAGPPQWIGHYARFDDPTKTPAHAYQLPELRWARQAKELIEPAANDEYIHLLDGGLIDNLGVRSTLAIEDNPARVPGLYLRLGAPRPDGAPVRPAGYEKITRVVYVVVNARTRDPTVVDASEYPPGALTTTEKMIFTQLDNSILNDEYYVIAQLEATADRPTPGPEPSKPPFLSDFKDAGAVASLPMSFPHLRFYLVAVNFDLIPDPKCREYYWSLGTTWGLKNAVIDNLIELGGDLVRRSADLAKMYDEAKITGWNDPNHPPDFTKVCSLASK